MATLQHQLLQQRTSFHRRLAGVADADNRRQPKVKAELHPGSKCKGVLGSSSPLSAKGAIRPGALVIQEASRSKLLQLSHRLVPGSSSGKRSTLVCHSTTGLDSSVAVKRGREEQKVAGTIEIPFVERVFYRVSSNVQMWLLQHPNFLTKIFVRICYVIDALFFGAKADAARPGEGGSSLWPRALVLGNNFCALGQLNISEREKVKELILSPQARGQSIAWIYMVKDAFPNEMLLFMSDKGAGGDGKREKIKKLFLDEIFLTSGAQKRAADQYAQGLIQELVAKVVDPSRKPSDPAVRADCTEFAAKYIHYVVLDLKVEDILADAVSLMASYTGSRIWPIALFKDRNDLSDSEKKVFGRYKDSPVLKGIDYAKYGLTKEDILVALQPAMAVAGIPAITNVTNFIAKFTPPDANLSFTEDKKELGTRFLHEFLRFHTPVSTVDMVTVEPLTVKIGGKNQTFPPGTTVGILLWLAQHDQRTFPDPLKFDPTRPNHSEELLSFLNVGDKDGGRSCPARKIAESFTGDYITMLKKAGWKPNNEAEWFK